MSSRSMNRIWLALGGVERVAEPVARLLGDLTTRHDERVINEHAAVRLGVEDLVGGIMRAWWWISAMLALPDLVTPAASRLAGRRAAQARRMARPMARRPSRHADTPRT